MSPTSPPGPRSADLDRLLLAAAPVQDADLATPAVRAAVADLARVTTELPRPDSGADLLPWPSRPARPAARRRRVAGLSMVSAVWALSATGVAAAGGYALYSGFVDSPDSTESVRGEEYVDVGSPEFADAFTDIAAGYPLPAGRDYDPLRDAIVDTGGLKQLTGTAGEVGLYSSCVWAGEWVQANAAADAPAEQAAVAGLERAATSSDLAAIDGGGVVDRTAGVATAAADGDATTVAGYAASADCTASGS